MPGQQQTNNKGQQQQQTARKAAPRETRIRTTTIISGRPGIGKTKRLKKLLKALAKGNPQKQKPADRVVIFDVNDEYDDVTPTRYDSLADVQVGSIRRLMPYKRVSGKLTPFSTEDRQNAFVEIVENFENGTLILEDFSSYCVSTRKVNIMSLLNRLRHKGVDVIIVVQDIGKVTKELWATIGYYHFHKQTNSIDLERKKITNFFLVKIADNIVSEQFQAAEVAFSKKIFGENEKKDYQSFCVEIDYQKAKIYGSAWPAYERAVKKYLVVTDKQKEIKDKCLELGWDDKNNAAKTKALDILVQEYKIYFGGRQT